MREIIYCVEVLKQKHEILKNSKVYFLKIQNFEKCAYIRDDEKQIERVVKKLLKEIQTPIKSSDFEENIDLINRYNILIDYFEINLEERKTKLEIELAIQQENFKTELTNFNFIFANKIREEIRQTEKKIQKIKARIKEESVDS